MSQSRAEKLFLVLINTSGPPKMSEWGKSWKTGAHSAMVLQRSAHGIDILVTYSIVLLSILDLRGRDGGLAWSLSTVTTFSCQKVLKYININTIISVHTQPLGTLSFAFWALCCF